MSRTVRRFEVLLPTHLNDGTPIPVARVAETLAELEARFGAGSYETQTINGRWHYEGRAYRDDMVRVFVDTPESRHYFAECKERLKARFEQLDIWMTTYLIEVL